MADPATCQAQQEQQEFQEAETVSMHGMTHLLIWGGIEDISYIRLGLPFQLQTPAVSCVTDLTTYAPKKHSSMANDWEPVIRMQWLCLVCQHVCIHGCIQCGHCLPDVMLSLIELCIPLENSQHHIIVVCKHHRTALGSQQPHKAKPCA